MPKLYFGKKGGVYTLNSNGGKNYLNGKQKNQLPRYNKNILPWYNWNANDVTRQSHVAYKAPVIDPIIPVRTFYFGYY